MRSSLKPTEDVLDGLFLSDGRLDCCMAKQRVRGPPRRLPRKQHQTPAVQLRPHKSEILKPKRNDDEIPTDAMSDEFRLGSSEKNEEIDPATVPELAVPAIADENNPPTNSTADNAILTDDDSPSTSDDFLHRLSFEKAWFMRFSGFGWGKSEDESTASENNSDGLQQLETGEKSGEGVENSCTTVAKPRGFLCCIL